MGELLLVLGLVIDVAFSILAIRTVLAWTRQPERRHGHLALAFGSLALLTLIAPLVTTSPVITDIAIALFLLSGYGLIMFRDSFVPLGRILHAIVIVAIVGAGALAVYSQLPSNPQSQHSSLQSLALVALLGVWTFCILEPIVRFSMAARAGPGGERAGVV